MREKDRFNNSIEDEMTSGCNIDDKKADEVRLCVSNVTGTSELGNFDEHKKIVESLFGVAVVEDPNLNGNGTYEVRDGMRIIRINPNATLPMSWVLGHELNHHLHSVLGAKEFAKWKEAARKSVGWSVFNSNVKAIRVLYARNGIELTDAKAEEECAANIAAALMRRCMLFEALNEQKTEESKSFFDKIKERIGNIFSNLHGKKRVEHTESIEVLVNALERAKVLGALDRKSEDKKGKGMT